MELHKVVIDPGSEDIKRIRYDPETGEDKLERYYTFEEKEQFAVVNREEKRTHSVMVRRVSDIHYMAACDCEDWHFRRKNEQLPCIHILEVIHDAMVDHAFAIPPWDEAAAEGAQASTGHAEAMAGNTQAEEGATKVEKKGEPAIQPESQIQGQPAIVVPVIDEETAIEHFQRFQRLKQRVLDDSDYIFYDKNGKPTKDKSKTVNEYIRKSGWRKIALMFNISCSIISKEKFYGEDGDGKYYGWIYYVKATAPNGRVQDAEGVCTSRDPFFCKRKNKETGEYEWVDTDEKNIMHTAQTRGFNRAVSDLVGSGELSAEEVGV